MLEASELVLDIREKGFSDTEPLIWFCTKNNGKNMYHYPQLDRGHWGYFQYDKIYRNKVYDR